MSYRWSRRPSADRQAKDDFERMLDRVERDRGYRRDAAAYSARRYSSRRQWAPRRRNWWSDR